MRAALFESAGRPGYARLKLPLTEVKPAILGHAEFAAFQQKATQHFDDWREAATQHLTAFDKDGHPKALIETIAEDLLAAFRTAPLLDAYDVYQHLMDYWAETMQDDAYLDRRRRLGEGSAAASSRSSRGKNKRQGQGLERSVPEPLIVARYFAKEQAASSSRSPSSNPCRYNLAAVA